MAQTTTAVGDVPLMPWEQASETSHTDAASLLDAATADEAADESPNEPAPEADEAEGEDEAEEQSEVESESDEDEEEPEDSEPESDEAIVAELDGEKITRKELKEGRLRLADYTRKTQELSTQRKAVETDAQRYREARETYAQRLDILEEALTELKGPEPNWDKLREENPVEFAAQWAEAQQRKEQREILAAERKRLQDEQAQEAHAQALAYRTEQRELLLQAVPEWKDAAKARAEHEKMLNYAQTTYGFTKDDVASVANHAVLIMLRKAMLFDEMQTKGKEIREKPAKVLKPGAVLPKGKNSKSKRTELSRAQEKLARSGRAKDAQAVFRRLLDEEGF